MKKMCNKINIMYLLDDFKNNTAGTERQLLSLIDKLDKKKFKVTLVSLKSNSWFFSKQIKGNFDVISLNASKGFPRESLSIIKKLLKIIKEKEIHIIQTYFIDAIFFGVICSKLSSQRPVIITTRRDMGYWYTPTKLLMLRLSNRFTDFILVNSNAVKENVIKKERVLSEKIKIFPNGIDERWFKRDLDLRKKVRQELGLKNNCLLLGLVGNLRPVKRIDIFLKSLSQLEKNFNKWKALILGSGPLVGELESLAESLAINDKIRFTGAVDDPYPYYCAMDFGVSCSDSEGLSNSLIEMMAQGLPIICTDIPSNRELLGKRGLFFEPGQPEDLAHLLNGCVFNMNLMRKYTLSYRQRVEAFKWDNVIKGYDKLYVGTTRSTEKGGMIIQKCVQKILGRCRYFI